MKAQERHHLKQNEFAATTARLAEAAMANRDRLLLYLGAAVLVAAVGGGYLYIQKQKNDQASALFGAALTTEHAPIVPAPTLPGSSQQAGTFATEQARGEAAVAQFQKVIDSFPNHEAGIAARYHKAAALLSLGRAADAEAAFREAASRGAGTLVAATATLGLSQALVAQNKFDEAIKPLTELSGQRDSELPMDGVLMELARVCQKAGKTQEARAASKRVVDEFPQSGYAGEARQQLAAIG